MSATRQPELRREVDQLGRLFGEVIKHHAGQQGFDLVEEVRTMARKLSDGDDSIAEALRKRLAELSTSELSVIIRSFTIFLELANLAEDRQRIRVIRQRDHDAYPEPRSESIGAAFASLHEAGLSTDEIKKLLARVKVELVFTAHPTEAKRRSVRRILIRIRQLLKAGDDPDQVPRERDKNHALIRGELHKLWQTDFVRPWRPTVLQEVERGLAIMPGLWSEAPVLLDDVENALARYYPKVPAPQTPIVSFGSWIGGDRDGNPFVTPTVTAQTLTLLRQHAVQEHRGKARQLGRSLSMSDRLSERPAKLEAAIEAASKRWPSLAKQLADLPPLETYRRWMHVVRWRLSKTLDTPIDQAPDPKAGGYFSRGDLATDVELVAECLKAAGDELIVENEIKPWLAQIRVFGLHTARLDLRQHSAVYRESIDELWKLAGLCDDGAKLDEPARVELLVKTLASPKLPTLDVEVSDTTRETLELFALVRRMARQRGMGPFGAHILSMTQYASDILAMLWLWRWSECVDGGHERDATLTLPVSPLFETIDDLERAPETLRAVFGVKTYRDYVAAQGNDQMVMVGYSDSTKDGGYLSAQWALQQSQSAMQRVATDFGIELTFFHGRGGSLGRGGGPAARSILSLPSDAFNGSLRLTEQGEVLAERYGTPEIAYRHLEQVCWSSITAAARDPESPPKEWVEMMDRLAATSLKSYRKLVDSPTFADFYREVTPIDEIERLPIGSRPSKRKAGNRIEDLRAIPWVFSWTQCRAILPAWYGIGSAVESIIDDAEGMEMLRTMLREWPFFEATISNAELALAKANMPVFELYGKLGNSIEGGTELAQMIVDEYQRSRRAVCAINGTENLLDQIAWLQRSIQVRNGYVDPLNVVQVVLLERLANDPNAYKDATPDDLEHLMNLDINGVSAGMRTTG
ncbi:phosphoenolpyruvate carboxylase [Aeoliella sp. SH292]|uniref:phosphoenolpyruvate carboxylase n=1 Tax=Aeoliella sp. SH292 TaxID=3454464 RepID=UPI003F9EA705